MLIIGITAIEGGYEAIAYETVEQEVLGRGERQEDAVDALKDAAEMAADILSLAVNTN